MLPNSHSLATMTGRRPGTGLWKPSLNWLTPRPRGQCTDRTEHPRRPYRILNNYTRHFDQGTNSQSGEQPLPLCDRCGEEIALANDLDKAGDIDRRRHLVLVAGKPRRLTPNFWRLFTLLYGHRGDVVDNDLICAELFGEPDQTLPGRTCAG